MPIDFSDFLRSTRSDAKLIISNAIKAVHGSKLVTDARDSPTALDFDLEDENGVVETVSIPKGGGGGGGGLTTAQVNDLIDEHRDVEDAHHVKTPPGTGSGGLDQDEVDARVHGRRSRLRRDRQHRRGTQH